MMSRLVLFLALSVTCFAEFNYDEELARELTAITFASKCSENALSNWNVGFVSRNYPNVKNAQVFRNDDAGTKGYIAYNANRNAITLAFRGSVNIPNWIEDLTFSKTKYNDVCKCQVHSGFLEAYESLKEQIFALFPKYVQQYPNAAIHIAGHSLGGAIATLVALDIEALGHTVQLHTVGSPRVGDPAFFDYFNVKKITHYRVVHEKDMVPHLPMHSWGFIHQNREIWYTNGGYTICSDVKGEDKKCSYSVIITSAADHSDYLGWNSTVDCEYGSEYYMVKE